MSKPQAKSAASVILLRDAHRGPEVLLVRRSPALSFMGGAWVFPGGSSEPGDRSLAHTGLRELEEEAGVRIEDARALAHCSRRITPPGASVRFDTHFFVTVAPPGTAAVADGSECVDARWLRPADALDASERGEMLLVLPTVRELERLVEYPSAGAAVAAARANGSVEDPGRARS